MYILSILFTSIKLQNFRQFKNEKIEFSCSQDKMITIILGNNTAGKTTLVNAFLWCLYKVNPFDDKILMNSDVVDSANPNDDLVTSVTIDLEHNDSSYTVITKETYGQSGGNAYVKQKALTRVIKTNSAGQNIMFGGEATEEINSILSPELKEYFFFDAENNTIESIGKKKNLKDSVSYLMGLKKVETIRDYYDERRSDSVTSRLISELKTFDENAFNTATQKKEDAIEKLRKAAIKIADSRQEIEKLEKDRDEKQGIVNANIDIKDDLRDKESFSRKLIEEKEEKENNFNSLINSINNSNALLKLLFAHSFVSNNLNELLKSSSFSSGSSLSHISEEAIDQLIARGRCLCGTIITDKSDAYNHLIDAKNHMEPKDFGKYASDFSDAETNNVSYASSVKENIFGLADMVLNNISEIDRISLDIKDINSRIEGRPDVGEYQRAVNQINGQINNLEGKINYIRDSEMVELAAERDKQIRIIESLSGKDQENDFTNECIAYSRYIYNIAKKKVDKTKKEIRENLENIVNEVFKTMYHGNRTITIDEDFKVDAKLDGSLKKLDKSTGLETVKNFAFVTGLMKMVKDKITSDDAFDENIQSESYPLVIDAPFSNTDDKHIVNICRALPLYCNQIIIVVMPKDYNSAKGAMLDKIGKIYEFEKHTETETVINEVE